VRLLVIEDEDRLSGILKSRLGDVGFTVDIAGSAADASAALDLINYDAAVLDLGLPDGDGLAVLAAARQVGKALPWRRFRTTCGGGVALLSNDELPRLLCHGWCRR
jgi:DNA-binding response OmpR family regulator